MSTGNKRFRIFFMFLMGITLVLIGRYAWIMLLTPPARPVSTPSFPELQRGAIYDRNGKLMAIQTRLDSVTAWVPEIKDSEQTAAFLADALNLDQERLQQNLENPSRQGFQYIKRQISPTESRIIREMIQAGTLPGIRLEPEMGRNYPEKELASHVIGYVGTDNIGLDGIEYTFNQVLSPPEISTKGDKILYGNDVFLTIDLNTQYITEQIAREAMEVNKPEGLMIMVMGAETGELYSMVSLPSFNPNTFSQYTAAQRNNLPVTLTYEPGSVMKIFSMASFMELGGVRPDDSFDTRGGYNPEIFQKFNIPPITDLGNYGILDTTGILINSSNVGTALASDTVNQQDYYNMLKNFGFGSRTGIPLPGESNGILNRPERWSARSKPTIAIGQEIGVSAIQMISAATVFANSGELLKPRIVSKVVSPSGEIIKEYPREAVREVISPEVAESVLLMMEQVVSSPVGTVRRAQVPGLRISGKSGTAQKIDPETGTYSSSEFMSSVLAMFPTEDPKLIIYVILQVPRGQSIYGGRIASPIVKELAERLSPYYGIPIAGNTVIGHDGRVRLPAPETVDVGEELPDFTGLSKREVMAALEGSTIPLTVKGEGWVVFQFPPAGEVIDYDTTLFLEFK